MSRITIVRVALVGLVGFVCTGCLEAGPRGYFESSVYGSTPVNQKSELRKATRDDYRRM
ncbi:MULTISPECIES: hypothetical protein [unclassified Aureimonas]|uniref:hypothetical protein n=1 Tax=unclassified Aureimonas TaxID=2615206 RepID=UPI000AB5EB8B|nr:MULTISPECIES: hypothetical protein [unclassified Aureimonas]